MGIASHRPRVFQGRVDFVVVITRREESDGDDRDMTFSSATPYDELMFRAGATELRDPLPLSSRRPVLQNRVPASPIVAPAWSSGRGVPGGRLCSATASRA